MNQNTVGVDQSWYVSGAGCLVDASGVTYSNFTESTANAIPSIYDIKLNFPGGGQA